MKITKKPEFLILKKTTNLQLPQESIPQVDTVDHSQSVIDPLPPQDTETTATEYLQSDTPLQDYPILPSAGNSGWQASDIWRELRVDSFYD